MNVGPSSSPPGPPITCITLLPKSPHPVLLDLPSNLWTTQRPDVVPGTWRSMEGHPPATYIFPAQCGFAALAENISYRVKPREQEALFSWPTAHVDPVSGNRKGPAPNGVALSAQPPRSPKALPSGEFTLPNWKPLPSAVLPFMASVWVFFSVVSPVLPILPRLSF